MQILEDHVFPKGASWYQGAERSHRMAYHLPNGSDIICIGCDDPDRIMSSEYQFILIDEGSELSEDQYEKLCTRLRSGATPYRQIVICTNPSYPSHWIKRFSDAGRIHLINTQHSDNPTADSTYLGMLSKLTGHRRTRLFLGEWCSADGTVYEDLIDCFVEPPLTLPTGKLFGGCDWGFSDPKALVLGTYYDSTAGRICFVTDELYQKFTPNDSFITSTTQLLANREHQIFADPSGSEFISAMQTNGLNVHKAKNDVIYGIDSVNTEAKEGRLFVSSSCKHLYEEACGHTWHTLLPDVPAKDDLHHLLDALRYMVASVKYYRL
jgi:phage terminase large subunit